MREEKISPGERGFMVYFSLKLGARRASDYARFFERRDPRLAEPKRRQAELFGKGQSTAVERKWSETSRHLEQLQLARKNSMKPYS